MSDGARTLFEKAAALARSGRPEDGVRFIEDSAKAGDPDGNFIVAHWHLYATDRPRDVGKARTHLERSAKAGSAQSARILAYLTAAGIGGDRDFDKAVAMLGGIEAGDGLARKQLELLAKAKDGSEAKACSRERLSDDPHVEIVRGLLSADECQWLIDRAGPMLKPSYVDDGKTGIGRPDPIRTSHGAAFLPHEADLLVQSINARIALVTGTQADHGEALYVMRYSPGQQYRPHLDALPGLANQREWTAIAYLNRGFEGGATVFPGLDLSIRGEPGDLLVYRNVDLSGGPDPRLQHAGEPVASGEKWIATRWIRSGPHDPYDRG